MESQTSWDWIYTNHQPIAPGKHGQSMMLAATNHQAQAFTNLATEANSYKRNPPNLPDATEVGISPLERDYTRSFIRSDAVGDMEQSNAEASPPAAVFAMPLIKLYRGRPGKVVVVQYVGRPQLRSVATRYLLPLRASNMPGQISLSRYVASPGRR